MNGVMRSAERRGSRRAATASAWRVSTQPPRLSLRCTRFLGFHPLGVPRAAVVHFGAARV